MADVKRALSVNSGAVEGTLGGAVMVITWTCAGYGVGAGEALVRANRIDVREPRRLIGGE